MVPHMTCCSPIQQWNCRKVGGGGGGGGEEVESQFLTN